MVTVHRSQFT